MSVRKKLDTPKVMEFISSQGTATVAMVAEKFGASKVTVGRFLLDLKEANMVTVVGTEKTGKRGRPVNMYRAMVPVTTPTVATTTTNVQA